MCILCTTCVPDARSGQKNALDLLELELQVGVSYYVGDGT